MGNPLTSSPDQQLISKMRQLLELAGIGYEVDTKDLSFDDFVAQLRVDDMATRKLVEILVKRTMMAPRIFPRNQDIHDCYNVIAELESEEDMFSGDLDNNLRLPETDIPLRVLREYMLFSGSESYDDATVDEDDPEDELDTETGPQTSAQASLIPNFMQL